MPDIGNAQRANPMPSACNKKATEEARLSRPNKLDIETKTGEPRDCPFWEEAANPFCRGLLVRSGRSAGQYPH